MRNPTVIPNNKNVPVSVQKALVDLIFDYSERYSDFDQKMIQSDVADYRKILALLKKGKRLEAARMASSLDTEVRDEIPDVAWKFLFPNG